MDVCTVSHEESLSEELRMVTLLITLQMRLKVEEIAPNWEAKS